MTSGVFSNDTGIATSAKENQGFDITSRLTYAPYHTDTQVVHLGAAYSYQQPKTVADKGRTITYRTQPESFNAEYFFTDTGDIEDIRHVNLMGVEAAGVLGPVSLQGEYIASHINRDTGASNLFFDGWYVMGSYLITGESRPYDFENGVFTQVLSDRRAGAWEAAAQYSQVNLTDNGILGGKTHATSLGLNWYINDYIRMMYNTIFVNNDANANADDVTILGGDNFIINQMRFQARF